MQTRSQMRGVCLNTAPKSQLTLVSNISDRDAEEIMILRGLDGALKLADVVARTNLTQETIVSLIRKNLVMANFTDFDLAAEMPQMEEEVKDEFSQCLSKLSRDMENVMGRMTGVERAQVSLQQHVKEMEEKSDDRFEQMLGFLWDKMDAQSQVVATFMERLARQDQTIRQHEGRIWDAEAGLAQNRDRGVSHYEATLMRGWREQSSSTPQTGAVPSFSAAPPFSNQHDSWFVGQASAVDAHSAEPEVETNQLGEGKESLRVYVPSRDSQHPHLGLDLRLAGDRCRSGLATNEETEMKEYASRGPRLSHAEIKRRKEQHTSTGWTSKSHKQGSTGMSSLRTLLADGGRSSRPRSSSEETRSSHKSHHKWPSSGYRTGRKAHRSSSEEARPSRKQWTKGESSRLRDSSSKVEQKRKHRSSSSEVEVKSRKYRGKQEQVRRRSVSLESSDSSEVDFDGRNRNGKRQQKSKRHRRAS